MKIDKITIPEITIREHMLFISRGRINTLLRKALRATILDEWDHRDGKEYTTGDQIFEAKDKHELATWIAIRNESKKMHARSVKYVQAGRSGGRPKKLYKT